MGKKKKNSIKIIIYTKFFHKFVNHFTFNLFILSKLILHNTVTQTYMLYSEKGLQPFLFHHMEQKLIPRINRARHAPMNAIVDAHISIQIVAIFMRSHKHNGSYIGQP